MRFKLRFFMLMLFCITAATALADENYNTSVLPEKRGYYAQIEQAQSIYEAGGELTSQQKSLLISEGIIHSPTDEVDEMGGPDAFGYRYIDSQEDGGPVYDWIDITDTGTPITNMGDDDWEGPLNLPFTFNFYGNDYNQVYICSNGYLMFGGGSWDYTNDPIPSGGTPNNIICFFWDDLYPPGGGTIYYGEDDDGNWVCTFDAVDELGVGNITCQAILYPSGVIVMQYNALNNNIDINSETIGIENSNGTIGLQVSYNTTPAAYPFAELAIKFWTFEAFISGTVIDDDTGFPIENAELSLYLTGEEEPCATAFTNEDGEYTLTVEEGGTYNITAYAFGYVLQTSDDIVVEEADELTQDFALIPEETEVQITGYVYSADTPDTPVEEVTVTLPELGVWDITDENGFFNLGTQLQGLHDFQISHDPAGSEGYHDLTLENVLVNSDEVPLQFELCEIMAPVDLSAVPGNEHVVLNWGSPDNHPEQLLLFEIQQEIQGLRVTLEQFTKFGAPDERSKIPFIEERLRRLEFWERIAARGQELDEIIDFSGYRIMLDGEILDDLVENTSYTVTGLDNGHEYAFAVAADYGYGDEYLLFSEQATGRPLPDPGYVFLPMEYEWIEINPANGGEGIVAIDQGDDSNSGEVSFDPLAFEFYEIEYSSFGACTNGWFSFTDFVNGTIGPGIPNTSPWQPNAMVCALNGDYHAGNTGDDLGIWYLVDEPNNQVTIQFRLRPWAGNTQYRFNYQVVLNCDNATMHWNYHSADNWMEFAVNNGLAGVENEDGTIGSTYSMANITDEMSLLVRCISDFGNVIGTVTTIVDEEPVPVEGAYVFLNESPMDFGISDENGYYEILLVNPEDGPYTVICHADGYEHAEEGDVDWENQEFDQVVDFVVDEISARTPPYVITWDGYNDDGIDLVMGEPGVYEHLQALDELDEFLGFNVYYSTDDGENYTMHNVDPIEDDTYLLNLGSDLEDTDLMVYLTATVDSSGEIIETEPSLIHDMIFNMSPSAPEDLDVVNVNHPAQTATLSWDIPTDNADGSLLIDLEDYELYRGGTHIATVTVDEGNTYAEQVIDAGYFTYKIVARDEVGNSSDTTYSEVTRIGDPPFWTSFEPDAEPEQPNPFETDGVTWEWGAPLINPDGGYDGTAYCWNTVVNGNYMPNLDEYLVSTHAWNVISDFYLIYYHWTNFAGGDGYNLQISTDLMETWEIVQPTTNYPGQFGLASEPGFTGSSNGWQMVEFDLSQFNDADSVYIQFHLGSNANDNGPGVAIDNLEIWGVPREARGCVEGFVFDHQDQPMEGARVFVEDLPFFQAFTNQEGHYFLLNAPAGDENNVVCEYPFYWPCVAENFEIIERDTVSLDFTNESGMPLLYPDGELETTSLEVFVNINEEVGDTTGTGLIELESIGSGPLAWNAYVRVIEGPNLAGIGQGHHPVNPEQVFSGPKNRRSGRQLRKSLNMVGPTLVDPGPDGGSCISDNTLDELWNPLLSFNAQTQAGNTGIVSAVTTSDRIYVSAVYMDDETSDNILYEYNHAGDLFMSYAYPVEMLGVSGYGPIDIAHDPLTGDLIGCNADGEIYRFAPDMTTYELLPALVNFSPTAIAYDWDADLLYLREWGNEFVAVDPLSGDVADLDTEPTGESVIGMGYMPLDDQGYTIWLMAQNADGQGGYVYRYNPLTTEYDLTMTEVYTPAEGSAAGGMEISNGWRSDFWDITTVYQTTMDLVDVWEGIFSPAELGLGITSEDTLQPGEILNVEIHADMRDVEGYDLVEGTEIAAEIIFNGSYWANPPTVDLTITIINDDVAGEEAATPDRYALHQNYPNPFNPLTLIRFDLVEAQEVKLMVYNVLGREVARLVDQRLEAGYHNIRFNAEGLASGVYFYRIESPAFNNMKKMVLVK